MQESWKYTIPQRANSTFPQQGRGAALMSGRLLALGVCAQVLG